MQNNWNNGIFFVSLISEMRIYSVFPIFFKTPGIRLRWTKVGTAGLPSNAAQYDGELVIDSVQESDAGQYRCTASGDHQFATDDASLSVEPKPQTTGFFLMK